jgi:hypothetical protein
VSKNYEVALRLFSAGFHLIPIDPNTGKPKKGFCFSMGWAIICDAAVDMYFNRGGYIPAIHLDGEKERKIRLCAVDLDRNHGDGTVDGISNFKQAMEECGGSIPVESPLVWTKSKGLHLYFRVPDDVTLQQKCPFIPGCDFKSYNNYTIAPGAICPDGRCYSPARHDLAESYVARTIPELPEWILDALDRRADHEIAEVESVPQVCADNRGREYALSALDAIERDLSRTPNGQRNHALFRSAARLAGMVARGWLSRPEVEAACWKACQRNGYLSSTHPSDGPKSWRATFKKAYLTGYANPARDPKERYEEIDPEFEAEIEVAIAKKRSAA